MSKRTRPGATPETDAAVDDTAFEDKNQLHTDWVTAFFARKLERERDEAREKCFALRDLSNNATELAEKYKLERDEAWDENKRLREEVEDLKVRYRSAMMDRDSYRFQAEQKYAMRRELEELLGIDHGAPGDEQFKKGLKALKAVVRKAKLYDKKN